MRNKTSHQLSLNSQRAQSHMALLQQKATQHLFKSH